MNNIEIALLNSKHRKGIDFKVWKHNGDKSCIKKSESLKLKAEFGNAKMYLRNPIRATLLMTTRWYSEI